RAMCGPTRPTKPMIPQKETTTAARVTASAISPIRTGPTFTPKLRAASSPAKAMALRSLEKNSVSGIAIRVMTPTMSTSDHSASFTEPKVQRMIACSVFSFAVNWSAEVRASKIWVIAMPSSSRVATAMRRAVAMPSTTAETASAIAMAPAIVERRGEGRGRGDPEGEGADQRVAQQRLHEHTGDRQGGTGSEGEQDARQPQLGDDGVGGGELGADGAAEQSHLHRAQHVADADPGGADRHRRHQRESGDEQPGGEDGELAAFAAARDPGAVVRGSLGRGGGASDRGSHEAGPCT